MYTILYPYFCITYNVLTTKSLPSVTVKLIRFTHLTLFPHYPSLPLWQQLPCVYVFVFVWFFHWLCFGLFIAFFIPHRSEVIQYLSASVWIISLSITPSRSIHVVANGKISSFVRLSSIPLYVYLCVCTQPYLFSFFIHSFVDGHLGYFHISCVINTATMNMGYK